MTMHFLSRCMLTAVTAWATTTSVPVASSAVRVGPAAATTFTVNSVGDQTDANAGDGVCDTGSGTCTLRAAIEEANANAGADTIQFSIGSGARTISPATGLPSAFEALTIDGTTQPGYAGTPLIEIDGVGAGPNTQGLHISPTAAGSTVRGLLVNRFPGPGIVLGGGSTVESCHIGTDATRTQNRGNGNDGISVNGDGNAVRFNVVAFNGNHGVVVYDGSTNGYPAFTGLTADHTSIFPSVSFTDDCGSFRHTTGTIILDGSGNSFNENFGMRLTATMNIPTTGSYNFDFTQLDDNGRIVIDSVELLNVNGGNPDRNESINLAAGNHTFQIDYREGGGAAQLVLNITGPAVPTFTSGGNPGLQGELFQETIPSESNTISQNSIFDNANQGIALGCCCFEVNDANDLDIGANTFLNHPVISNHFFNLDGTTTIQGTAPAGSVVEVFASTNDGSGRGEGKVYLTTSAVTGGDGNFTATFTLPQPYYSVTTTATDAAGNTSEFSQNTPVRPRPISVTSTADNGPGSLRNAINDANSDGVASLITFDATLNGAKIQLFSPLPALSENGTTINGDMNADCRPDIEISGGGTVITAITIQSQGNTIRGLAINRATSEAILIEGGGATNNVVVCNYLGLDHGGGAATGGDHGVFIRNGAANNEVGRIAEGNVITGFVVDGIRVGSPNTTIVANSIGFGPDGSVLTPPQVGIQLAGATNTSIGRSGGGGNRIVGTSGGIDISGGSANTIRANTIGWPAGTATPTGYGIRLHVGTTGNIIGGTAPGTGNRIENNGGSGIHVEWASSDFNTIRGNSITGNGALGIDLDGDGVTPNDGQSDADTGANEGLNFPLLTRATSGGEDTNIEAFLDAPAGTYAIDFYVSETPDPSGYGEGATFLQSITTGPGMFSAVLPTVPIGTWITATTNIFGNTSEFSLARQVTGRPNGATELAAYPVLPNAIALRWRDPQSSETGFRIERSSDGINFGPQTTVGPDTTTWTDATVVAQNSFYYRVIATSAAGDAAPSNVAFATAFSNSALKICRTDITTTHQYAASASVVHNGTNWAVAFSDKKNGRDTDIFLQFLNNSDGAPSGPPIQVTSDDVPSNFATLAWNGTQYGLLWLEHIRQPDGDLKARYAFAVLDNTGAKIRGVVRFGSTAIAGFNADGHFPLIWDGAGWGTFVHEVVPGSVQQTFYYRLSATGDVLVNRVPIVATPPAKLHLSAAFNGTEYGVAFVSQLGAPSHYGVRFVRVRPDGTIPGSFTLLGDIQGPQGTSVVWDGTGWAVVWSDAQSSGDRIVSMRRLDASGTPLGAAPTRLSNDGPTSDSNPKLQVKPGGGFLVYANSNGTAEGTEVGRLEADANGNRVGTRTILTTDDGFESTNPKPASNGTAFLVAWEESSVTYSEVAAATVTAGGARGTIQNVTSGHTPPGTSLFPNVIPMPQHGFVTVWNEFFQSTAQIHARVSRGDGTFVDRRPLNDGHTFRPVALSSRGSSFGMAWTDTMTGAARFQGFSPEGTSLAGPFDIATGVNVGRGIGLDFNGEVFGALWVQGGQLRFQRLTSAGMIGSPTTITNAVGGPDPRIKWIGSGWAIVWSSNRDLWYARLDASGAIIVPPTRVTDSSANPADAQLVWSGEHLGLAWNQNTAGTLVPGAEIYFTAIDQNGIKKFAPVLVAGSPYADRNQAMYWDGQNFQVVYPDFVSGIREITISPAGVVAGTSRFYGNHGEGRMAVAFNGATLAMAWQHQDSILLQTKACLADATPPPCLASTPSYTASFSGGAVQLSWPPVNDPESGILAWHVYRDGALLAELRPNTLSYSDGGFTPGATHVYEVRAFNGAYLEATGCTTRSVIAGIAVNPPTLPDGNVGSNYTQAFSGAQGTAPYTFAMTSGSLPPGLSLNGTTGALTGNPTTAGVYNFTITATDSAARTGSRAYTLRVCSGLSLFPTVLTDGYLDRSYSQTLTATGGQGAVTLAITSGTLPTGLTIDASGWIHGTPTTVGTSNFTITATDSLGCTASRPYTIVVETGQAVRGLSAFVLGTTSIRLRWADPQRNETTFRIERSSDLGLTWEPIAVVGGDTVTHTDSNLTAGSTYSYRVVAVTPSGDAPSSNLATAMTFPATAAKTCLQPISPYHSYARSPSVVFTGTQWAMVYTDRTGGREDEVFFTFLDANGARTGSPVQITNNDMGSFRPTLRWNGSKFGVMWTELHRSIAGEPVNPHRFALLDATGAVIRSEVVIPIANEHSALPNETPFFWDGSAWSFFESHLTNDGLLDVFFHRFDEDGDLLTGPVRLTTHPGGDSQISAAWNGTEYGLAWSRFHDQNVSILFQRVSSSGALIGSAVTVVPSNANAPSFPDIVATASGWAFVWREVTDNGTAIFLQRLNASGGAVGPATKVSDDFDLNGFTAADGRLAQDNFADIHLAPGGGFLVFTTANVNITGRQEIGLLRADSNGAKIGTRIIVTPQDAFHSSNARVAGNGTSFLVAFNENRLGTLEIASTIINSAGATVAGPTDLTTGHSPGNSAGSLLSGSAAVAGLGAGFAALFVESGPTTNQFYARIFDGTGALSATKSPLSTRNTRGRPSLVGVGSTFAAAWKDPSNAIVFGRWDASGNPLFTEVNVATGQGGPPNVNVGFDGENYGVLWNGPGAHLTFQRVSPNGTLLGTRSILAIALSGIPQQMVWTGAGWAITFISDNDVYYTLLDAMGATLVPPIRVTFTPTHDKIGLAMDWNGEMLGVAFSSYPGVDPPGLVIKFTMLDLNGIKDFAETVVAAEGRFDNSLQGIYWDADRFRVIFVPGEGGTLRSVDVGSTGAVLGSSRLLANRGFGAAVALNGATTGMIWLHTADLYFQTSACLSDTTPPTCPALSGSRTNGVTLTWAAATDAESGIARYVVYRDGVMIGDAPATATQYVDRGVRASDAHSYRLVAVNRANLESAGCTPLVFVAPPTSVVATAAAANQVQVSWTPVTGAERYDVERSSDGTTFAPAGQSTTTTFSDTTVQADRAYLYRVRSAAGSMVSPPGAPDLATTVVFTDDPLVAGQTVVKSVHLIQLRTAVNAVRQLAGLAPSTFTNASLAGVNIRRVHVNELRTALNQARTALTFPTLTFTDTLVAQTTPVKAVHLQELRNAVK